jgi:hypothetical protein
MNYKLVFTALAISAAAIVGSIVQHAVAYGPVKQCMLAQSGATPTPDGAGVRFTDYELFRLANSNCGTRGGVIITRN